MSNWLHSLPIGWMAVVFFGSAYLSAAAIYLVIVEFARGAWVRVRSTIFPSMLSPLCTLFAFFVVFTAAQVWTDNNRATAAVAQEASALKTVLILAADFPEESRARLETLVHGHIEEAATKEWPMMARDTATLEIASRQLTEALQRELVAALESALDARRQRILISHSSVGLVKWACLVIQAVCVLISIALAAEKRSTAIIAMGLFATGAAACLLLIGAYDRPFIGQLTVRPDPLLHVLRSAPGQH